MNNWIDTLMAGDQVIAFARVCTVVRLTATQVVFAVGKKEHRAARKNGRVVGYSTGHRTVRIRQATDVALAELRASDNAAWARYYLSDLAQKLPPEKLATLRAFFEALQVPCG